MKRSRSHSDYNAGPSSCSGTMALQTTISALKHCKTLPHATTTSSSSLLRSPPTFHFTQPQTHFAEINMPELSVKGVFGLSTSTKTDSPGMFSISLPGLKRGDRAQSEPLNSRAMSEDTEMGAPELRLRARSVYNILATPDSDHVQEHNTQKSSILDDIYESQAATHRQDDMALDVDELQSISQSISQRPRAPSPAATEIDDPESQDVVMDIQARGVKVRDFAFLFHDIHSSASVSLPTTATTTTTPFQLATEIFDPYKGLAELEYRWTQPTRIYPIAGRTSRRLLDLKWISQAEWDARAHPMDIEDLQLHDSRPIYPWRPLRWTSIPTVDERRTMMIARATLFNQLDRMRARHEDKEATRAYEAAAAEALQARFDENARMERERVAAVARNKRRLGTVGEDEDDMNTASDFETEPISSSSRGSDAKKRRITPEPSSSLQPPRTTLVQPHPCTRTVPLAPPEKQYPAPLHSYDPVYFPEAASIIESSSQSSSQPRPIVPERCDTPPLTEEEQEREAAAAAAVAGRGNRLVHPRERKAMQRGLSRTQTFAEL